MRYFVTVAGRTLEVDLGPEGVRVDGTPVEAELSRIPGTEVHSLLLDGRSRRLLVRRNGRGVWDLHLRGRSVRAEVVDERARRIREMTGTAGGGAGPRPVRAPMPGLVVKVEVEEGREVRSGDGLVVVEAMKMENELKAEAAARVKTIYVSEGETVDKDQVLIDFDAPEDG